MPLFRFRRRLFLVMLAAAATGGCGRSGPELGTVTGIVSGAEGPIPGATVEFHPDEGRPSFATTDTGGRYDLAYTADRQGAVIGQHSVRITLTGEEQTAAGREEVLEAPTRTFAFGSPVTVNPGANTIDLDLSKAKPL